MNLTYFDSFCKDYVRGEYKPEWEKEIKRIYFALFRQRLTGCKTCMIEAVFKIINSNKIMGQFQIKKGIQFVEFGIADKTLNWKTQTDELCIYHLKKHPEYIKHFDRIPEDFLKTISTPKVIEKKEPEKKVETILEIKGVEVVEIPDPNEPIIERSKRGRKRK